MGERSFCIITNGRDAAEARPDGHDVIIAFDVSAHQALAQRGIDHRTPLEIIPREARPRFETLEDDVWRFWSDHGRLERRDIDLLALARYRHRLALRRLAWIAWSLDEIIERLRPDHVTVVGLDPDHALNQPAGDLIPPFVGALTAAIAEQRGLNWSLEPGAGPAVFVDRAARQSAPPSDLRPIRRPEGPHLHFHANGPDVRRQQPLVDEVLSGRRWTIIRTYRALDAADRVELDHPDAPLVHADAFAPLVDVDISAEAIDARRAFDTASRETCGLLRSIFAHPRVRPHFDFIFGEYARALARQAAGWEAAFTRSRPDALISTYPTPAADLAAHFGIPVVHLPHGLMMRGRPELAASHASGTIVVPTPNDSAALREAGVPMERIASSGDPAIDPLLASPPRDSGDHVLIITAAPAVAAPDVDWAARSATEIELARALAQRSWPLALRGHPRRNHSALAALLPRDRVRPSDLVPLPELSLRTCAAALAVDALTSVIIELAALGVPVVILDTALTWTDHRDWGTDAFPIAHSVGEAIEHIDRLCRETPAERSRQARASLTSYAGCDLEIASPRVVELVIDCGAPSDNADVVGGLPPR